MNERIRATILILAVVGSIVGSSQAFAAGTECYAHLNPLPNATAVYGIQWTRVVTFAMNVTCDFDPHLQIITAPPGMTMTGNFKLKWTPANAQLGNTYPVTLRFTVDWADPPHTTVETKTFYITVVDCEEVDMDVDFTFTPDCSYTSDEVTMKAFLINDSSCYVTVSGKVYVDDTQMGTFTNMALTPNERALAWSHFFPHHGDGVEHLMEVVFTYSSIPLREGFSHPSYNEIWSNECR
jgi:hypothetical protein